MFEDTNWKTVSAEFLGTLFLVFFGVCTLIKLSADGLFLEGTLTLGLTLFVLVHILGPVSGCHLNPVITIPVFISGKMNRDDAIAYIFAQVAGATVGFKIFDELTPGASPSDVEILMIALVGTTFFVASLLTSQDPASIAATLFVVTISSFGDVNPGVAIASMLVEAIEGNANWAFFGILGSLIGCLAGYTIKENVIDD